MEIIPAILPKNFKELEEKTEAINGIASLVQVDICDGKYVPTITWPYWKQDPDFEAILKEERGMPFWETVNYEFDLMIENPTEDDARKWLSAGAERMVLHLGSSKDLNPVIDVLNGLVEVGIAVSSADNIEDLAKYINKIQFVQIMGIRKAGFQGSRFENTTFDIIKKVKELYPDITIQIDGGVSMDNAEELKNAGVARLVAGSAIFNSDDIVDSLEQFRTI
jgi:ribulose-phosphate 3-epimerase